MIADEIKTDSSVVRIHDEFCSSPSQAQECISHLNQIVSNSYRRRNMAVQATPKGEAKQIGQ